MSASAAERADSIELGNCTKAVTTYKQLKKNSEGVRTGGAALYYPATTMGLYRNCQITDIYLSLFSHSSTTSLKVFIASNLDGDHEYEQEVTPTGDGWTRVTLDEPYQPDGTAIYIGYEIEGPMYISYTAPREEGEEWLCRTAGEWELLDGAYSTALYAVVRGDDLPAYNVRLKTTVLPEYAVVGEPYAVEFEFSNLGTETVNSLQLTYAVDDDTYMETIEGLDVAYQKSATLTAEGLVLNEECEPDVTFSITQINGEADLDMSDNVSRTVNVVCREEFVRRKVLLEVFSTELCPNCPTAHAVIEDLLDKEDRIVEVCHHSGYYTDQFTADESVEYEWFYKTNNLYAPAAMLDRTNHYADYPDYFDEDSPVFSVSSATLDFLAGVALDAPAFVSVNMEGSVEGNVLSLKVSGERILPTREDDCRLFVMLVEDNLSTDEQSGASGTFTYQASLRQCVSDTWGDEINLSDGFDKEYTVTLSDEWDASNLRAVAFVSYYNADDHNQCEVLNVEDLSLSDITAISQIGRDADLQITGNNIMVPDGCQRIDLFDASGMLLASFAPTARTFTLDYPEGMYLIRIIAPGSTRTVKAVW